MLDEVVRQLVQPIVGCDDCVVLAKQFFEQGRLVGIELGLLDYGGNAVVQVESSDPQLFASVLVDQLHRGAVFFGPLEVVARDVGSKDASSQVVALEQGRPGEPDK